MSATACSHSSSETTASGSRRRRTMAGEASASSACGNGRRSSARRSRWNRRQAAARACRSDMRCRPRPLRRYPEAMPDPKEEHEQRLARLEHMIEELRVQTKECVRLTTEARLDARATKEKSQ